MLYQPFSPNSDNTNISNSKSRMNFNKLVSDWDNGLIRGYDTPKFKSLNIMVRNVKTNQTVSAQISSYNKTFNREYTSKYEDTIERNIHQELSSNFNADDFINYIKARNNNLDVDIISGLDHYSTPVGLETEFYTKFIDELTGASYEGNKVDRPIRIKRTPSTGIYINLVYFDALNKPVSIFKAASNDSYVDIPAGTITDLSKRYTVGVDNGVLLQSFGPLLVTGGKTYNLTLDNLSLTPPTISNLSYIGNLWEKPITINWRSELQEFYEWEAYYNNAMVANGTGTNANTFDIPANTFRGTLPASVRVRVGRTYSGTKYYSQWAETSITLKNIEATISNLIVTGNEWENPITLTWLSENQQQFKVEVYKNNTIVKTYTGTTAKTYTIVAEQLTPGLHTFKVTVGYANRFVNSDQQNVDLKNVLATISNLSLSGSNIDLALTLNWSSENQQKYEVEIYKNQTKVKNYTGTTNKFVNVPAATLTVGLHTFKVRVAFKDRWSEWKSIDQTLIETLPSIGILEPDGRIVNKDEPTRVYWTSTNQSKWELNVSGNMFNGTFETEKVITAGLLGEAGRKSMTLKVHYVIGAKDKVVQKTVEFIARGIPSNPTITSPSSFNYNRPVLEWDTSDQKAYQIQLLDNAMNIIYDTGWLNGLAVIHKIHDYIPNGNYIFKIRIKNIYADTSNWSSQQIIINAVAQTRPTIKVYEIDNIVTIKWDNPLDVYSTFYIFRDDEMIASTNKLEYADYTAQGSPVYRIRGVTNSDVYSDSKDVVCDLDFNFPLITCGGLSAVLMYRKNDSDLSISYNPMSSKVFFDGRKKPVTFNGIGEDVSYSFTCVELNSEAWDNILNIARLKQPVLYRSNKYKLWLTLEPLDIEDNVSNTVYTIDAYETDYSEVIDYD